MKEPILHTVDDIQDLGLTFFQVMFFQLIIDIPPAVVYTNKKQATLFLSWEKCGLFH